MLNSSAALTERPEWHALIRAQNALEGRSMRALFEADPQRANRYQLEAAGLVLDFSRNRVDSEAMRALCQLADACGLKAGTEALFTGGQVNATERRPALHTALRQPAGAAVRVDGEDIIPAVHNSLARMEKLVEAVVTGDKTGHTGQAFTDIVSIGIGGSFLGPKLVVEALKPHWLGNLRCHFVANIDGTDITEVLGRLNPESTLILLQSKSFRTQETLENGLVAREWLLKHGGGEGAIARHFLAVTANTRAATRFGIAPDNIFPMWDWVGGRYSLWSAIGLPIAFALGMKGFQALLAGAHQMDCHFREQPANQNMPVIMAMLGIWNSNFWGAESLAILPYDEYLRFLPEHLQQLDMESNGKRVTQQGQPVSYHTGPVIWGGVGANGQHAYHQLLHQGTRLIPADFIIPLKSHNPVGQHHANLFANCLSQARALMTGKTEREALQELIAAGMDEASARALAPHKVIPGNKPSNILLMESVTPATLGALIALYEHRTFVQSIVWDLDCFDQWGVELGKQIGSEILPRLTGRGATGSSGDSATDQLIQRFRSANSR